jgi:manganese transport protein
MQLGFAIIPLLHYVSDPRKMGEFALGFWAKLGGWTTAVLIVALNVRLVLQQVENWLLLPNAWAIQWLVIPGLLFAAAMLLYITFKPMIPHPLVTRTQVPHAHFKGIDSVQAHRYEVIAIALDFSSADQKAIEHALHIGGHAATYLLLHAVETAGAWVLGSEISDLETASDVQNLEAYAKSLRALGYTSEAVIGYGSAKKAIPLLVKTHCAHLLVMGAHGHHAIKDLIFGTTVEAVRHDVDIPVLIVR